MAEAHTATRVKLPPRWRIAMSRRSIRPSIPRNHGSRRHRGPPSPVDDFVPFEERIDCDVKAYEEPAGHCRYGQSRLNHTARASDILRDVNR